MDKYIPTVKPPVGHHIDHSAAKGRGMVKISRIVMATVTVLCGHVTVGALAPSDMSLAMFKAGRVKEPTVFKVQVAVAPWDSVYEGSPIYELRDQFWAIRARPIANRKDSGDSAMICYAKKSSVAGKVIAEQLKDGGFHAALVSLRYSRNESYSDCCIVQEIEMLAANTTADLSAKFSSTRLTVVKNEKYDYVQGKITVSLRSSLKYFKKPILRVIVLTEENGSRVVRDTIVDEPNVKMISSSDSIERNTTTCGDEDNEPPLWQKYIEEISTSQSDVAKDKYKSVSYEGVPLGSVWRHTVKGERKVHLFGYAKFDKDECATMVGYRLEMWHNGSCLNAYDSISASRRKGLELPDDWHVSFKHPEKFKYRSPFSTKNVVTH